MRTKYQQFGRNKGGFTLIEMLIVIVIIGLLASIAISSFWGARKKARMDIAVDTLASIIKEQRGKAQAGRVASGTDEIQNLCRGLVFQKTAPFIQTIQTPYRAIAADGTSKADYCDATTVEPTLEEVVVTEDVLVKDIQKGGGGVEKFVLMFKPPYGSPMLANDVSAITEAYGAPAVIDNPVKIVLSQEGNEAKDDRALRFDIFSGSVARVAVDESSLPASP